MEYVCGDLLGFIRKRGKLSELVSKLIFKQLIEGLKYIHKKNVIHRDIKLDNILIDLTNTVKICDFGVSRKFEPDEIMYDQCGTPAYICPEIFENNGYKGTGCDIWSAGVTLYYMLGGVQPFKANSLSGMEKNIIKGDFIPLEEVSPEANDLIRGMLQVNPKKRLGIEEILNHPWLDKVDLNQRQKLNLFTEAEKILLSKFDVNYLSSDKSELIENFTIKNLEEEDKNINKNGNTKSLIYAPYNTYIENNNNDENIDNILSSFEEVQIYKEIQIMNDICKFGWRAQQENIQYELSNNGDFDNGLIKTQKEEDFKKKNEKIEKLYLNKNEFDKKRGPNTSRDNLDIEEEMESIKLNYEILDKIEQELGYDKKYIIGCIRKSKVNYATGTYYLLSRENQYV
jgi:serine/threonine protein kinase